MYFYLKINLDFFWLYIKTKFKSIHCTYYYIHVWHTHSTKKYIWIFYILNLDLCFCFCFCNSNNECQRNCQKKLQEVAILIDNKFLFKYYREIVKKALFTKIYFKTPSLSFLSLSPTRSYFKGILLFVYVIVKRNNHCVILKTGYLM